MEAGGNLPEQSLEYLRRKHIPDLMEQMLRELVVHQPEDPLAFLAELLVAPVVPRVVMAGPPASGKGTQTERLRERYGSVVLRTAELLQEETRQGTRIGKEVSSIVAKGELVPDELLVAAVRARLGRDDAKQHGWILQDFPRTKQQALALQAVGVLPLAYVQLDVPEDAAAERIEGRRIDPVTNRAYHLAYNPPPGEDPALLARLEHRSSDTREALRRRLVAYKRSAAEVQACYSGICTIVNGDRDVENVFEDVEAAVTASLEARKLPLRK